MSQLPNLQDNNEQILNDIQLLQQMEQKLFNSLETNPNLSTQEKKSIIEKINQLSSMRRNLYQTLSGVNSYFQSALDTSIGTLKEQAVAIDIVEKELDKAKMKLIILEEEKNNKIRLVEINRYFGDKYAEHSQLMIIIILTLVPIIILAYINSKGYLPNTIYYILIVIISIIGAYFFWVNFSSIIIRDNMDYQAYNWPFDPNIKLKSKTSEPETDPWETDDNLGINLGTCIGDACCSKDLTYDSKLNQCVTGTKKESFISVLTKLQPGNYKISYDLREPKPFNN